MKTKILVSACLLGHNCKYNGKNNKNTLACKLEQYFQVIPVCPEVFGQLPTPRAPSEIVGDRVVSSLGEDVTEQFESGAEQTLYIAKEANAPCAVLKERSPSCGFGEIYDGSFSGTLCRGNGVTADLLCRNDIQVFGESQIEKLIDLYYFEDSAD